MFPTSCMQRMSCDSLMQTFLDAFAEDMLQNTSENPDIKLLRFLSFNFTPLLSCDDLSKESVWA